MSIEEIKAYILQKFECLILLTQVAISFYQKFMIKGKIVFAILFAALSCNTAVPDTKYGKQYNTIRLKYGSPVIHDYMELKTADEGFELWRIPPEIHDTITSGFHAGKGFSIYEDSILHEDDIFRKRIDDSTFAFIGILTRGNLIRNQFTSIYLGSVDARELKLNAMEYLNSENKYRDFPRKELTIKQADSILHAWGTSRFR